MFRGRKDTPTTAQPSPSSISRPQPTPNTTLSPLPLLVTSFYVVFFNLTILDISYKWIYQILWHNVFKVFPYGNIYQNSLPFQGQIPFSYMDMPQSFIHPSFDGLLRFLFVCCTYCCHTQEVEVPTPVPKSVSSAYA